MRVLNFFDLLDRFDKVFLFLPSLQAAKCWIKSIFYRVFSPPLKLLGNYTPLWPHFVVKLKNNFIFFQCPFAFLNVRRQSIKSPLSALLACPPRNKMSRLRSLVSPVFIDELLQNLVFLYAPRTFNQPRLQNLSPPVQTLDWRPSLHVLSDFPPVSSP